MCIYQSSSCCTIHYIAIDDTVSTRVFYSIQILLSAESSHSNIQIEIKYMPENSRTTWEV